MAAICGEPVQKAGEPLPGLGCDSRSEILSAYGREIGRQALGRGL